MKNTLLICLLCWSATAAFSQSETKALGRFHLGVDLNINETQMKSYLFDNSAISGSSNSYYGIGLKGYLNLKNNWYVGLGGSYNVNTYLSINNFEKTQVVSSPINTHEEVFDNMVSSLKLTSMYRTKHRNSSPAPSNP